MFGYMIDYALEQTYAVYYAVRTFLLQRVRTQMNFPSHTAALIQAWLPQGPSNTASTALQHVQTRTVIMSFTALDSLSFCYWI